MLQTLLRHDLAWFVETVLPREPSSAPRRPKPRQDVEHHRRAAVRPRHGLHKLEMRQDARPLVVVLATGGVACGAQYRERPAYSLPREMGVLAREEQRVDEGEEGAAMAVPCGGDDGAALHPLTCTTAGAAAGVDTCRCGRLGVGTSSINSKSHGQRSWQGEQCVQHHGVLKDGCQPGAEGFVGEIMPFRPRRRCKSVDSAGNVGGCLGHELRRSPRRRRRRCSCYDAKTCDLSYGEEQMAWTRQAVEVGVRVDAGDLCVGPGVEAGDLVVGWAACVAHCAVADEVERWNA